MGSFLEGEKPKQTKFKTTSPYFSGSARLEGIYKGKPRPFCVPIEFAEQNLFPEIRESALSHFAEHGIKWHDGQNGKSSNHLCDSQVCCVNFLFPFADKPEELAQVFYPIFSELEKMLPIESGKYVSFEWIGQKNYLGEKISRNGQRTRGANYTSADSIVMFERKDKRRQVVLIEWKYTESYGGTFLKISDSGTDRTNIYRHLFESVDCHQAGQLQPVQVVRQMLPVAAHPPVHVPHGRQLDPAFDPAGMQVKLQVGAPRASGRGSTRRSSRMDSARKMKIWSDILKLLSFVGRQARRPIRREQL